MTSVKVLPGPAAFERSQTFPRGEHQVIGNNENNDEFYLVCALLKTNDRAALTEQKNLRVAQHFEKRVN